MSACICESCKTKYETVFRVPNSVWPLIAPFQQELGDHHEHMNGGLLCMACADREARKAGVDLVWEAATDWTVTPTDKQIEAAEKAMQNAELDDGEGTKYRLFDLLDFSGENKARIITRQLVKAALSTLPASDSVVEECRKVVGQLWHIMHDACHENDDWPAQDDALREAEKRIRALKGGNHG